MPDSDPATAEKSPVTAQEFETIFATPAPYVSRSIVTANGPVARLSFVEFGPDGTTPYCRAAVTMQLDQLLKLRDLINKLEEDVEIVSVSTAGTKEGG